MIPAPSGAVGRGIAAMLIAVAVFAVMDATMKELAHAYPPLQVSCLRGLASIPFFLAVVAATGQWRNLVPQRWLAHLMRGALAILMLISFIYSVGKLPLGTVYGIFLCSPLLITALSAWLLREHVGIHRWLAILCGLIGVVIILKPSGQNMVTLAGLAAFTAALCYALAAIMIRRLTRTESTMSIALSFMVIVSIGTGVAGFSQWLPIAREHWVLVALLGLTGSAGQYLIVQAFRLAPASTVAPFEYTALLWGLTIDWIVWSTIPSARMLTGAGIVIVSGLYVIYREHWASRQPPRPLPDTGV